MRKFTLITAIFLLSAVGAAGFFGCGSAQKAKVVYPPGDFKDNGNGTVTDNNTGLMWQKEDDDTKRVYDKAVRYCEDLSLGGYSDWRLPDLEVLKSIRDLNQSNPAIDSTAFPNTNASIYWSSYIDHDRDPSSPWFVNFYNGNTNKMNKGSFYYVRCVRSRR